jgi:hypothetical protein
MKKALALLALLGLLGCAGRQYTMTEGPFRGQFARPFTIQYVNQPWSMPIFLNGVLPTGPVHIEGYLVNNGAEYYQYHADLPEIRARSFEAQNVFTTDNYCEAIGRPMDRFSADESFWNRGQNRGDTRGDGMLRAPEDVAEGEVIVRFGFYELKQNAQEDWVRGKLLLEVKTRVRLKCPQCMCGGQLR